MAKIIMNSNSQLENEPMMSSAFKKNGFFWFLQEVGNYVKRNLYMMQNNMSNK